MDDPFGRMALVGLALRLIGVRFALPHHCSAGGVGTDLRRTSPKVGDVRLKASSPIPNQPA